MPFNKEAAKKRLFEKLPPSFVDPVTGHQPTNENELSALLALFHQRRLVAWNKINLYLTDNNPSGRMANELFQQGVMLCEYPFLANSASEIDTWGKMAADLAYIAHDNETVVVVENKIGSGFTGRKGDVVHGQLAKQAEYLLEGKVPNRYLVLLSTQDFFDKGWYKNELRGTLSYGERRTGVTGYLMRWEDVLAAMDQ